jgi:hypothetical protein
MSAPRASRGGPPRWPQLAMGLAVGGAGLEDVAWGLGASATRTFIGVWDLKAVEV